MKQMCNLDIRTKITENGLLMREVAFACGITPCYLSHLLGHELRPYERTRILDAIEKAKKGTKQNG